ncbi:hypothetical protein SUGI_0186000 [Cryptomeria japonica]|nr:hypothetical protein SUGI_0186000 [Cryptomeria japonica]
MSEGQAQARRGDHEAEAITYGDVFKAREDLAKQPVTPGDAALMQSAETRALGQTQKGGVAAQANERAGVVAKDDDTIAAAEGMTVTETVVPGRKVTVEYVGGQLVSADVQPSPAPHATASAAYITIVGGAAGYGQPGNGGVAAAAQSAANVNPRLPYEERTTVADVLFIATEDLPSDKAVIMEDVQKIKESEARQSLSGEVFPGGVGDAMEAAAKINERGGLNVAR